MDDTPCGAIVTIMQIVAGVFEHERDRSYDFGLRCFNPTDTDYPLVQTNRSRMFTGEARRAFLEFLRNLTPQILFLTLAFIFGVKLDLTRLDLSSQGIANAAPSVMCLIVFLGATFANLSLFIDAAITSNVALDQRVEAIKQEHLKAWKRTAKLICAAWKHNKPAFFQLFLVVIIVEVALVAVLMAAIQGAVASPFNRNG